ncbi:MAG: hypothetical protein L6Q29_03195 [Candidatus Pacebacteria bacterium]|nr:hypothetical protein [Candidatus Paceibacterota bacterium]
MTFLIILIVFLFILVFVLHIKTKELSKELSVLTRQSAYLETTIKDVGIILFNKDKGKYGEFEINKKLKDFLE